jgi:hypothetical protein
MFGTEHLALFVISGILLNLTPGQDTLYIVGRSVSQGRRAGLLSVLGIVSGSVIHTLAAAFGLSAILATSARAFVIVKLAGAAYLAPVPEGVIAGASYDLDETKISLYDKTAVFTARVTISGKNKEGKPFTRRSRFTDVFTWRDGRWQIVAGHSSRIPEPKP